MTRFYSEADDKAIAELASQGLSASMIGAKLGRSRNSIISRCSRKGIHLGSHVYRPSKSASPAIPSVAIAPKRRKNVRGGVPHNPIGLNGTVKSTACGVVRSLDAAGAPAPFNLTVMDLALNSCRWPMSGEKEHTLFCGHPRAPGLTSYCPHHRDQSAGFLAVEVAA